MQFTSTKCAFFEKQFHVLFLKKEQAQNLHTKVDVHDLGRLMYMNSLIQFCLAFISTKIMA